MKQRIQRTQAEARAEAEERAAEQRDALPHLPGFDKTILEKRYTSKLSAHSHLQQEEKPLTIENLQIGLPQQHWLSVGPKMMNQTPELPPLERIWKEAREKSEPPGNESLTLEMLSQKTSPPAPTSRRASQYPGMTHRPPETHGLDESALKKIEKKIADETKHFKTTMEKNIASTNAAIPKANLNQMADDVYNIILDKVKKERKMRGL